MRSSVAPALVNALVVRPENPESELPLFNVNVPAVVRVPVPESVPLRVILPPLLVVGLFPSGKVQPEFTVIVPECEKVTLLKVALLQIIV